MKSFTKRKRRGKKSTRSDYKWECEVIMRNGTLNHEGVEKESSMSGDGAAVIDGVGSNDQVPIEGSGGCGWC